MLFMLFRKGSNVMNNVIYIEKKIVQFIFVIFLLSIIVFYMARLSPGDPLMSYYGEGVERMNTTQKLDAMKKLGLNDPIYRQYISWLANAAHGEYGISYKYKQNVTTVIKDVYINTIILGGLAYILTFLFALLLGIFCTLHEDKLIDKVICKIGVITTCIPSFWVSLILILIFSINLEILPSSGAYGLGQSSNIGSRVEHLLLPLIVLILSHLWYYTYMIRNKLVEETRQDYVLLCKVKGLSKKKIVYKHCLKNIMPSYISIMSISVSHILGGTYVVEKVFSYPGLGSLSFESAKYHDYNMLMVLCLITGILVVFVNMLAQVINDKIDPRMKHDRGDNCWKDNIGTLK
ncbi:ABC transporter permease [Clostridium estertheticum]|uniref:ABC transporter permease n=1 Tax=Clostridium estertheticum TaxID=238834 RepID=UPI0013EE8CA6|nr:ABC transporter permease [Clostridium estertheticum]MBZ9607099.1 ABC transporter permease [Clostridium estertheticum]